MSLIPLTEFPTVIEDVLRSASDEASKRPFLCEGDPSFCELMVVGLNPATTQDLGDWRDYWHNDYGMDRKAFMRRYSEERLKAGKPPFSQTRNRLNYISGFCKKRGIGLVETNIVGRPTASRSELTPKDFKATTYAWWVLFKRLKPRFLWVHGKDADLVVRRELRDFMVGDGPITTYQGTQLVFTKHLRLVSYDACDTQLLTWFPKEATDQILLEVGVEGGSLRLSKLYTPEGLTFLVRNSSQDSYEPGLEAGAHTQTSHRSFASAWESFIAAFPNWYEGQLLSCSQHPTLVDWIQTSYHGTTPFCEWMGTSNG
jgi:hypothetical protein